MTSMTKIEEERMRQKKEFVVNLYDSRREVKRGRRGYRRPRLSSLAVISSAMMIAIAV